VRRDPNGVWRTVALFTVGLTCLATARGHASGVFGNVGLAGGFRWDAAPRNVGANERSLSGGLRYSVQGGSYQAYRDLFTWSALPSVADFQLAVEQAFGAWTIVDPATGLGTALNFVADFGTPVVGTGTGGINTNGAEIDLLAAIDANSWNPGDPGQRGESFFNAVAGPVTLTSGIGGYAAGAISGADITLNRNPQAQYSLDVFRLLLTHEIGHSLGLADVDVQSGPAGNFIDDNYNGSSAATALATLTNSWAGLVNPLNPALSPLALFFVANGNPGIDTPGVNILMESEGLGGQFGNIFPLTNDDFGGRQFLYPFVRTQDVPEPGVMVMLGAALLPVAAFARGSRKQRGV
jgi:hypothetical protein